MVLEKLLHRSWEVRQCRRPPLGIEMDGFCKWLHEQGYSHSVMCSHLAKVSQFNGYLRSLGIKECGEIQELHAGGFVKLKSRKQSRSSSLHLAAVIRGLMKYLSIRGILIPIAKPTPYEYVLNAYTMDLRQCRGLAENSIKVYRHYLIGFLKLLNSKDMIKRLSELSPQQVHAIFIKLCQGKSDTTRGQIYSTLRTFLEFCARQGYVQKHLAEAVPKVFRYQMANVPRYICEENAQKLLESIDRSRPVGQRDYAIILLLYTYGIRGAQIRSLRLEDIQWRQSRIKFTPCKGGKEIINPLTDAAGEALLDYLRYGRPETAYREVFLKARAPLASFES